MTAFRAYVGCAPLPSAVALMEQPGLYFISKAHEGRSDELHLEAGCTDSLLAALNRYSKGAGQLLPADDWNESMPVFYGLALPDIAGGRRGRACLLNMLISMVESTDTGRQVKKQGSSGFGVLESELDAIDEILGKSAALLHRGGMQELDCSSSGNVLLSARVERPVNIVFQGRVSGHEILACGSRINEPGGSVTLSRGSRICRASGKAPSGYGDIERMLEANGSLPALDGHDDIFVLKEDLVFSSCTEAATFVTGVKATSDAGWGRNPEVPVYYCARYAGHMAQGMMAVHDLESLRLVQVLKGSHVMSPKFVSSSSEITLLKEQMLASGALVSDGDCLLLMDDLIFKSRTQAGTFITGTAEGSKELWANGTVLQPVL